MSASVNKVILIGNLGADPDIRKTTNGAPVATFNMATSKQWRDKTTGERKEVTHWHRVVIFTEGLCKLAEQYLKKGSKVYIEGELQTRSWDDKDGVKRYVTEVVLSGFGSAMTLLDRREGGGVPPVEGAESYGKPASPSSASPSSASPSSHAGARPAGKSAGDSMDDEIPF